MDIIFESAPDELAMDLLSGALWGAGVAGVELRDAPPSIVATFAATASPTEVVSAVEGALGEASIEDAKVEVKDVAAIDWATHWRRHFSPMQFGDLWVVPTWLDVPEGAQHVLRIDPGMAFGTGKHETTAMCLEFLVENPPKTLLDVGTGTAILAMGALLFGTETAVGTDNDPDALVVARENAEANGLSERIEFSEALPDDLGRTFDVVVANILRDPLVGLAPHIAKAVSDDGTVVLSGLLIPQVDGAVDAYERCGLRKVDVRTKGEWARVTLVPDRE